MNQQINTASLGTALALPGQRGGSGGREGEGRFRTEQTQCSAQPSSAWGPGQLGVDFASSLWKESHVSVHTCLPAPAVSKMPILHALYELS